MALIIPKETIEEVRSRSDIVDIIGRYCRLQKAGANFRALCPFHREKTPSFHVTPLRQGFHCFGCGKGGDVFRFLMEYENVDFPTAVRMLAGWAGVTVPAAEDRDGKETPGPRKDVLFRLHEELARWYHRQLHDPRAQAARDYLSARGLDAAAADFLIGYAPDSWNAVLQWGTGRDFSVEDLVAAGVVVRREQDGRCYDRFRDRLMFPVRDEQSRVIAFSGRVLSDDKDVAKYINSPETVLFRKTRVLFGLDRARRPLLETREALICEGQIDVIRCHQAGFQTAVAPQGTAFTEEQGMKLARIADSAVLVFDADAAGREAAFKTSILCLQCGLSARVAALPAGEDPDSLIRQHGAERFGEVIDRAEDALDFRLNALMQHADPATDKGIRVIMRGIADLVNAVREPLLRERMLQHAARRLVVDPALLESGLRQAASSLPDAIEMQRAGESEASARSPEELALIEHLVADPELIGLARDYLPPERLHDPACRQALEILFAATEAQQADILGFAAQHSADSARIQPLLAAALLAPSRVPGKEFKREDAVKDLILKIWRVNLGKRLQQLLRGGVAPGGAESGFRTECSHLRTDIKRLDRWETGADIIEILRDGAN